MKFSFNKLKHSTCVVWNCQNPIEFKELGTCPDHYDLSDEDKLLLLAKANAFYKKGYSNMKNNQNDINNCQAVKTLGKNIKKYREVREWSQDELGLESGLHRNYISDIERGTRNPSLVNIEKIAKAFNISVSQLVKDSKGN